MTSSGAAVGGVALVCVNGDVKPLSEILKTLSVKRNATLVGLIMSLTRVTFDLVSLKDSENIQLSKKNIVRRIILGAQPWGILHQLLKLISR